MVAQLLRQVIFDVSDLVELAAADHRPVEHVQDRAAQRLGPVEPARIGRVTSRPRSRSPTISSVTRVAFSVEPSTSANGCLAPSMSMPEGDHAGVLAEVHPVDHERDQVQPGQVRGQQLGQRGLGLGDEPARHRRAC